MMTNRNPFQKTVKANQRNQAESLEPKGNSQRLNDFAAFNNTSNLTRFIRDI
ncbi:hypothetical protein [Chamaesiphon sp.]|uniref:hypothetical protein n=1 Tax=Chamaesiphon sp. TaxID=2814140 RepID=UPI003593C9E9